jgi:hypothetical protein
MSESNVITLLSVSQTPTPTLRQTTPEWYDAILLGITRGVPKKDNPAPYDRWAIASEALALFLDDHRTKDYAVLRELALALAKMISAKPHPHDQSFEVAVTVLDLAYKDDLSPSLDWDARHRQCCATAAIMFSVSQAAKFLKLGETLFNS